MPAARCEAPEPAETIGRDLFIEAEDVLEADDGAQAPAGGCHGIEVHDSAGQADVETVAEIRASLDGPSPATARAANDNHTVNAVTGILANRIGDPGMSRLADWPTGITTESS